MKAAVALAAVYGFCVLLPALAFALADGRIAPPCLMEDLVTASAHEHGMASAQTMVRDQEAGSHHHHAAVADMHGVAHHHGASQDAAPPADPDHGKSRPGECCGLFPLMAFADRLRDVLAPSGLMSVVIPLMTGAMIGRGPDRIIRPPIA